LIIAASGWPIIDIDVRGPFADAETLRSEMERWPNFIRQTPRRLGRLVGAPIVHANLVGDVWSQSLIGSDNPDLLRFMGESQVIDRDGNVLAHRPYTEGEGLALADATLGRVRPREEIPEGEFWTPEFSDLCKKWWHEGGAAGRNSYLNTTRPHRQGKRVK
jgi:hypothetical protein